MKTQSCLAALSCCAVALLMATGPSKSLGQVVPFKVDGAGTVEYIPLPGSPPANHWAIGDATMLGEYFADGWVRVDEFTGPTTANFSSAVPVVFTAANGDELHFDYVGEVNLLDAGGGQFIGVWVAEFTPVIGASTGRFAKVIGGSFIMTATTDPFVFSDADIPYSWEGNGYIEFRRKR